MNACYVLACKDPYLGQIDSDQIRAHKLACMHDMFLHAQAHILAKLGQIREIKVSMEPGEHAGPP